MALPSAFSLHDSSLISGIELLPQSAPTSPHKVLPLSFSPPPVLSLSATSSLRRATSSGVTAQLYASLRRSRDLDGGGSEAGGQDSGAEDHFEDQGPTMSETDYLADEMSRRLQEGVETSGKKGTSYISQMESLRNHLQNMLSLSKMVTTHRDLPLKRDEEQSDSTSTLLNAHPIQDFSPPLSLSGLESLFPRYASLYNSGHPLPDLQLRDALERETTRRKHLERHVQNLQNEMLELQQRVALTLTADRRKDTMIQQLDQTLAVVVGGWKQQEQQREETLRRLKEEKESAEQARFKDQEMLTKVQQELSEALRALSREKQTVTEKDNDIQRLVEEKMALSAQLLNVQEREKKAKEQEHRELVQLKLQIQEKQSEWEMRERELLEECERLKEQMIKEVEREKALTQQELQKSQQWQLTVSSLHGEVQRLERDLQTAHRERDTLQMELNLEKARSESERVRIESEHKMQLEEAVVERLSVIHEENAKHLSTMRDQHRKQLLNLTSQHETELSNQLSQFKSELQDRERCHRDVIMQYEFKLSRSEEQTQELSLTLSRLESERAEMVTQLQGVMQSHWSQALRVLTSKALFDGSNPCPPPAVSLGPVKQNDSEEKSTICQKINNCYQTMGEEPGRQEMATTSPFKDSSSQFRERQHIMDDLVVKNSSHHMISDSNHKDIGTQHIVDRDTNCLQVFNTSHFSERASSNNNKQQIIVSSHFEGKGNPHIDKNSSNPQLIGNGSLKEDDSPRVFKLNQLIDSVNQNLTGSSNFKETTNQSMLGGSHNSSHNMIANNTSSLPMISSNHYKKSSIQSMMHGSPLKDRNDQDLLEKSNFKENCTQSVLTREEISGIRGQKFTENNNMKGTSSQSVMGSHLSFTDRDARSHNISEFRPSTVGVNCFNSQPVKPIETSFQNIIGGSNLKDGSHQSIVYGDRFKEVTSKLFGVSRQKNIASFTASPPLPQSNVHRAPSHELKSHPGYKAETSCLSTRRATGSEESFYPLQMEDLSNSFSSHMGFYPLEPYPDETTPVRASGVHPQDSPEQHFQEEPSIFENDRLASPPKWGNTGEQAPSNALLQYYIRMLLDRTPGDPLNEKDPSHINTGPASGLTNPKVTDISKLLATHSTLHLNELHAYLHSRAIHHPPRSEQDDTKFHISQKNAEPKGTEAVKKEAISSQRRPAVKSLKRVSNRSGRPGVWR